MNIKSLLGFSGRSTSSPRAGKTRLALLSVLALAAGVVASASTLMYTREFFYEDGMVSFEFHYSDGHIDEATTNGLVLYNVPPAQVQADEDTDAIENGGLLATVNTFNGDKYQH